MDYNRIMIITFDEHSALYTFEGKKLGVRVEKYFRKKTFIQRLIGKFDRVLGTFFSYFVWNTWKYNLNKIHTVILNSHVYSIPLVRFLNRKYPNIRVIIWYSNPVSKDTPVSAYEKLNCEIWSFDKEDCQRYHLRENNQFVDYEMFADRNEKINYDLCFVGLDKGRLDQLLNLKDKFKEKNISTYLYIVDSNKNSSDTYTYKNKISYDELLDIESKSKALLDIVQSNQNGQTLRPIEALFLKKKVITNNSSILKADFYNPQNVFVLEKDCFDMIEDFLNSKYDEIASDILEKYTVKGWINNFFL